jgi:hypothetical protein
MACTRFLDARHGLMFEACMPSACGTVEPLIMVIIHRML